MQALTIKVIRENCGDQQKGIHFILTTGQRVQPTFAPLRLYNRMFEPKMWILDVLPRKQYV